VEERVSRGLAVGDLDNDGRLDVVINDLDGSPQILHNEMAGSGNWIAVRLKGRGMNTGAVGAIVTARAGALVQKRLVQSGSSYISQEDKRLHFGLGKAGQVDSLDVAWPDGTTTTLQHLKANQIIEVTQPAGDRSGRGLLRAPADYAATRADAPAGSKRLTRPRAGG
jgi:hypothetical protein